MTFKNFFQEDYLLIMFFLKGQFKKNIKNFVKIKPLRLITLKIQ